MKPRLGSTRNRPGLKAWYYFAMWQNVCLSHIPSSLSDESVYSIVYTSSELVWTLAHYTLAHWWLNLYWHLNSYCKNPNISKFFNVFVLNQNNHLVLLQATCICSWLLAKCLLYSIWPFFLSWEASENMISYPVMIPEQMIPDDSWFLHCIVGFVFQEQTFQGSGRILWLLTWPNSWSEPWLLCYGADCDAPKDTGSIIRQTNLHASLIYIFLNCAQISTYMCEKWILMCTILTLTTLWIWPLVHSVDIESWIKLKHLPTMCAEITFYLELIH